MPEFLSHGAEAYGFKGQVWTCARAAKVIGQEFGVTYHSAHVSRLLKHLNWTPQKPIERASQRDEARHACLEPLASGLIFYNAAHLHAIRKGMRTLHLPFTDE